jgi:hypothetical protein
MHRGEARPDLRRRFRSVFCHDVEEQLTRARRKEWQTLPSSDAWRDITSALAELSAADARLPTSQRPERELLSPKRDGPGRDVLQLAPKFWDDTRQQP